MGDVIFANAWAHALADEAKRRYESLSPGRQRLVVELADETQDFACLSATEYRALEDAGLIETTGDSWDWTQVGEEVVALVRGMRDGR